MKEYITQESQRLEKTTVVPSNLTNVVSWRQEGIKYKKNDVFLDVIEKVNLLVARMLEGNRSPSFHRRART